MYLVYILKLLEYIFYSETVVSFKQNHQEAFMTVFILHKFVKATTSIELNCKLDVKNCHQKFIDSFINLSHNSLTIKILD